MVPENPIPSLLDTDDSGHSQYYFRFFRIYFTDSSWMGRHTLGDRTPRRDETDTETLIQVHLLHSDPYPLLSNLSLVEK